VAVARFVKKIRGEGAKTMSAVKTVKAVLDARFRLPLAITLGMLVLSLGMALTAALVG
jgi:hypothetical protein